MSVAKGPAVARSIAALLSISLTGTVAAQPPPSADTPSAARVAELEAERLFEAGKDRLASGDWTAACKLFDAAAQLDDGAPTLVKIARCRAHEGKHAAAIEAYARALHEKPWPELEQLIRSERREAEMKAATILVRVVSPPQGLKLLRNGRPLTVDDLRAPLFTDPGTLERFVATAPGYRTITMEIEAKLAGETRELLVRLEEDTPPSPVIVQRTAPPSIRLVRYLDVRRAVGYGLAGGGVLALGFSAGFAVQFVALKGGVFDGCAGELSDGRHVCPESARERYADAVAARTRAQVLLGVGSALAATGLAVALTAPPMRDTKAGGAGSRVAVRAGLGSVSIEGAF